MFKLKKVISLVLTVIMMITMTSFAFAESVVPLVSMNEIKVMDEVEAFEIKVRETGYEYAKKSGLVMSEEEMDAMLNAMESTNSTQEKQTVYENYKKYLISPENIYSYKPELKTEGQTILKKYPNASNMMDPLNIIGTSSTPSIGDYQLNTTYSYSERAVFDTRRASNYSTLQGILINLISLGLKPAQAIVYAILSPVIGSPNLPSSCTDYEMRSSSHTALTMKWGEVYSSGGLLGTTGWMPYVETQRLDTYSKMAVDGWIGNKFYTNTKSALVKYEYNQYYYNTNYIKNKALEKYQDRVDNYFTILYGVGVVIPEYNMTYHTTWISSSSNPF